MNYKILQLISTVVQLLFSSLITTCNEDEFTCKERNADGSFYIRCIPRSWINDGLAQCDDGSDEKVTSLTCYNDEWSCDGGTKCLQEGQVNSVAYICENYWG